MRALLALLAFSLCFGTYQGVDSDFYVVNAGLSKALDAASPSAVGFSRDGTMMAALDKSGALTVYRLPGGDVAGKGAGGGSGRGAVAFSPYGDRLATWGSDQKVTIWDARAVSPLRSFVGGKPGVVCFSADGSKVGCGGDDGTVRTFSATTGTAISSYKAHAKAILAMAFEPAGTTIVSVGADRKMTTGNVASGQVIQSKFLPIKVKFDAKPEEEFQQIRSASCTPDGSLFVIGGYSLYRQMGGMPLSFEYLLIYDRSGRRLKRIGDPTNANASLGVSISPDGKLVACSGPDGKVRIWDVQHNQKCGEQPGQGSIKMTAAARAGSNYLFGVAGKTANVVALTPTDADTPIPGEQAKSVADGLSIAFDSPSENAPIVNSANLEVGAVVSGLQGTPKVSIEIAGARSEAGALEVSDNRDLVMAPAPDRPGAAATPVGIKLAPDTLQIQQNVTLSEGPNRIKLTVQDGGRQVTAVKTVCFVPDSEQIDKAKVYSNSYAVVIGIDKYAGKGSKHIPGLTAAVADASSIADVLKGYGFADVTLLTDADATRSKIMAALNRLTDANAIKPNDRVVIFWSGHGQTVTAPEGGQIGFLLPTDAQVDFTNLDNIKPYRDTCVPMDELATLAREIPAKHVLFLVDACFSGLAATKGSSYPTNTFSLIHEAYFDAKQIITASSKVEPAKEKNGHGYFTKALLEAFQDPAADENGDGFLTATELYKYVLPKVQTMNPAQSPKLAKFSLGIGETLFFKPAAR